VTLDEAARQLAAAGIESPRAEARLLFAHALGMTRDEAISPLLVPTPEQSTAFAVAVSRRVAREPVAYITGCKEFWSLDFMVGPGVLVPRPDTETLIEEALRIFPDRNALLRIGDLGAGSGILLSAALREFPKASGTGFESSPEAFLWARLNIDRLIPGRADLHQADWNLAPEGCFDLILCNPPYIPCEEIKSLAPDVSHYEPRAALDGGPDGLDAYRDLAKLIPDILKPGGRAILEIGFGQAAAMEPLFRDSGANLVRIAPDLAGIPRALVLEKG